MQKEVVGTIGEAVQQNLRELVTAGNLKAGQLVVIGCSTSEVLGAHIGTSGTLEVAQELFQGVDQVCREFGLLPAFQCCEHLNRALVVSGEAAERYGLEPVSVIPMPRAGGSMAAYAYRHLPDAVVVEQIRAHAGIDIGSTLIGMHLRPVAVPVRPSIPFIGSAYVTMAYFRPKLIGGVRAVYTVDEPQAQPTSNNEVTDCK
ncbi:TIGR01440 family protein [Paenibacillus sp. KN14-4R]|uniref:TIGR01440 family protein n=1 Tax=Paenibacillus sp. KN14-4R TaxID=3445773 RepID=UPI003FA0342A